MTGQPRVDKIDSFLNRSNRLHSPPEVACSLLRLTSDDDFDIQDIVECIERDPALAAKLLQLVNSSRYGLRARVGNLRQAVAYLGQRTVRLVALTFSIVDTFARGPGKKLYNDYWRQALTIANAAARLSDQVKDLDKHDAYTAGLLADLGSLVLAEVESTAYLELYREASGAELVAAELEKWGVEHAEIGARLLQRWEFPPAIVEVVRGHHDDSVTEPLEVITRAGVLLSETLWEKNPKRVQQCRHWLETHYQINIDGFTALALACKEEVELEAEIYGVNLGSTIDCESIIEEARRQYVDVSLSTAMDLDGIEAIMDGA